MNSRALWLLAAVLGAVCLWALRAVLQPEFMHQLVLLMPLC